MKGIFGSRGIKSIKGKAVTIVLNQLINFEIKSCNIFASKFQLENFFKKMKKFGLGLDPIFGLIFVYAGRALTPKFRPVELGLSLGFAPPTCTHKREPSY